MARTVSISLDDDSVTFLDRLVESGRYSSVSEAVQVGLSLLKERETKLETLRAALIDGERSGDPQPLNVDRFLAAMRQR